MLNANQLSQFWDLLFGECRQIEKRRRKSKVAEANTQSDAPKGRVRQKLFVIPNDCRRWFSSFLDEEVGSSQDDRVNSRFYQHGLPKTKVRKHHSDNGRSYSGAYVRMSALMMKLR